MKIFMLYIGERYKGHMTEVTRASEDMIYNVFENTKTYYLKR